ncbi:unnamed protein product [Symbiodinium natans]|uniref:Uncharacterized protein n=1 Tax=Symbiodinium natans TaxID=878477 RepID=A0A812K3K1_9DINO|nr:unnamed protein product [Symbiodinium natans]
MRTDEASSSRKPRSSGKTQEQQTHEGEQGQAMLAGRASRVPAEDTQQDLVTSGQQGSLRKRRRLQAQGAGAVAASSAAADVDVKEEEPAVEVVQVSRDEERGPVEMAEDAGDQDGEVSTAVELGDVGDQDSEVSDEIDMGLFADDGYGEQEPTGAAATAGGAADAGTAEHQDMPSFDDFVNED